MRATWTSRGGVDGWASRTRIRAGRPESALRPEQRSTDASSQICGRQTIECACRGPRARVFSRAASVHQPKMCVRDSLIAQVWPHSCAFGDCGEVHPSVLVREPKSLHLPDASIARTKGRVRLECACAHSVRAHLSCATHRTIWMKRCSCDLLRRRKGGGGAPQPFR
eukprot:2653303-Pleurochrysis_carterae.AAC.2